MAAPERRRNADANRGGHVVSACASRGGSELDSAYSSSKSGNSRNAACLTICASCACASESGPRAEARRANKSTCPIRVKLGATLVVIAHVSTIITSGSRLALRACAMIWRFTSSGNRASLGSSISIFGVGLDAAAGSYHGRRTTSPGSCETTRLSARVVSTPRWNIASDARNSRMDERSTARPSAPRQNGVGPPPLSCISHLCCVVGFTNPSPALEPRTSPTLTARPSPYPLPLPKGQFWNCLLPMMDSAYGVAQVSIPGTASASPEKKRAKRLEPVTSLSSMPTFAAIALEYSATRGLRSGVGRTRTKWPLFTSRDERFGARRSVSGSGTRCLVQEWSARSARDSTLGPSAGSIAAAAAELGPAPSTALTASSALFFPKNLPNASRGATRARAARPAASAPRENNDRVAMGEACLTVCAEGAGCIP